MHFFSRTKLTIELLSAEARRKLPFILLLLGLNSLLELVGLGVFIPVLSTLFSPNFEKNDWINLISDVFGINAQEDLVLFMAFSMLSIVISKNIITVCIHIYISKFSQNIFANSVLRLFDTYNRLGLEFIKKNNSNRLLRNIRYSTKNFADSLVMARLNFLKDAIEVSLIVIFLIYYDSKAFLILIGVSLPLAVIYRWSRNRAKTIGDIRGELDPEVLQTVSRSIFGFIDFELYGTAAILREKLKIQINRLASIEVKAKLYDFLPSKIIETTITVVLVTIIFYGMFLAKNIEFTRNLLIIFALASYRIMPAVNRLMIAANSVSQFDFVYEILSHLKAEGDAYHRDTQDIKQPFNEIVLENISFSYGDKQLFKEFNLTVERGDFIGIKGTSGSGKSTLILIMLGLLDVDHGRLTINNVDYTGLRLSSVFQRIGFVQQQIYIMDASVAENVAFGEKKENIDLNYVEYCLRKAELWEVIDLLEEGLDENIGELGSKLSGGQRQRLGIARALYFKPEILIFDEATSSLDIHTQNSITESIRSLSESDLTILVIAHRSSALKYCKRIIDI